MSTDEQLAAWQIEPMAGGLISVKVTLLDGASMTMVVDAEEWQQLKHKGDMQLLISQLRQKHGVGQ